MKTRNGLVSNSSSSSFVVIFPKKPNSVDETFKYLFNSVDGSIKESYGDKSKTHQEISNIVFDDLKNKDISTIEELTEELTTQISHSAYYACESGRRNQVGFDCDGMMKCIDLFGSADYYHLIQEINKVDEEYYFANDNLVRKHNYKYGDTNLDFNRDIEALQNWRVEKTKPLWDKKYEILNNAGKVAAEKFIEEHKGWWYTVLSYADDSGSEGGFMEHSNIFRNIPHEVISHH